MHGCDHGRFRPHNWTWLWFSNYVGHWSAWLIFDMFSMGVYTSWHWQTSGRLVQELNVCTVLLARHTPEALASGGRQQTVNALDLWAIGATIENHTLEHNSYQWKIPVTYIIYPEISERRDYKQRGFKCNMLDDLDIGEALVFKKIPSRLKYIVSLQLHHWHIFICFKRK